MSATKPSPLVTNSAPLPNGNQNKREIDPSEVFSALSFPARILGRIPLFIRYVWALPTFLSRAASESYGITRYGWSYRLRPWLLLDIAELEAIESLINAASDEEVLAFRAVILASANGTTIVGSLLASACATMLTLDTLAQVNRSVRGGFIISLTVSLLSVYFTLVQQRELSIPTSANTLRIWLWNGQIREIRPLVVESESEIVNKAVTEVRESSLAANILLQLPFELLSISISLFLGSLTVYLALAWKEHVILGTGKLPGNKAELIAYALCTVFTIGVFGQALGQKDREIARCRGRT